ncbi:hypothetical protein SDRG_17224, partial [Saprolegnia diclina VS20]
MAKKPPKKPTRKSRANPAGALKKSQPKVITRVEILEYYHAHGENQTRTAKHFKENGFPSLNQSTISRYVRDEAMWRKLAEDKRRHDDVRRLLGGATM